MEVMVGITFIMVWFVSGLFSVKTMMDSDFKQAQAGITDSYWFKGRRWARPSALLFSLLGIVSLFAVFAKMIFEDMDCLMAVEEKKPIGQKEWETIEEPKFEVRRTRSHSKNQRKNR